MPLHQPKTVTYKSYRQIVSIRPAERAP